MASQEESDEEFLDDPIQLINLEQKRIEEALMKYNTSKAEPVFEIIDSDDELYIEKDNIYQKSLPKLKKEAVAPPVNFIVVPRNLKLLKLCKPLSIKLINCEKHPWYFKKYSNNYLCDKEVQLLTQKDDMNEKDKIIKIRPVNSPYKNLRIDSPKTVAEKSTPYECEKPKNKAIDTKQNKTLSKNNSDVDFKKNEGLVGMKITLTTEICPKNVKNTKSPNTNKSKKERNKTKKTLKTEINTSKVSKNKNNNKVVKNTEDITSKVQCENRNVIMNNKQVKNTLSTLKEGNKNENVRKSNENLTNLNNGSVSKVQVMNDKIIQNDAKVTDELCDVTVQNDATIINKKSDVTITVIKQKNDDQLKAIPFNSTVQNDAKVTDKLSNATVQNDAKVTDKLSNATVQNDAKVTNKLSDVTATVVKQMNDDQLNVKPFNSTNQKTTESNVCSNIVVQSHFFSESFKGQNRKSTVPNHISADSNAKKKESVNKFLGLKITVEKVNNKDWIIKSPEDKPNYDKFALNVDEKKDITAEKSTNKEKVSKKMCSDLKKSGMIKNDKNLNSKLSVIQAANLGKVMQCNSKNSISSNVENVSMQIIQDQNVNANKNISDCQRNSNSNNATQVLNQNFSCVNNFVKNVSPQGDKISPLTDNQYSNKSLLHKNTLIGASISKTVSNNKVSELKEVPHDTEQSSSETVSKLVASKTSQNKEDSKLSATCKVVQSNTASVTNYNGQPIAAKNINKKNSVYQIPPTSTPPTSTPPTSTTCTWYPPLESAKNDLTQAIPVQFNANTNKNTRTPKPNFTANNSQMLSYLNDAGHQLSRPKSLPKSNDNQNLIQIPTKYMRMVPASQVNHYQHLCDRAIQPDLPATCDIAPQQSHSHQDQQKYFLQSNMMPNAAFQFQRQQKQLLNYVQYNKPNVAPESGTSTQHLIRNVNPVNYHHPTTISKQEMRHNNLPSIHTQQKVPPFYQGFRPQFNPQNVNQMPLQNYLNGPPAYGSMLSNINNVSSMPYEVNNYWNGYYPPLNLPPPPPPPPRPPPPSLLFNHNQSPHQNMNQNSSVPKSVAGTTIIGCNITGPVRKISISAEKTVSKQNDVIQRQPVNPEKSVVNKEMTVFKYNANSNNDPMGKQENCDNKIMTDADRKDHEKKELPNVQYVHDENEKIDNITTVHSKEEMLEELNKKNTLDGSIISPVKDLKRPLPISDTINEKHIPNILKKTKPCPLSKKARLNDTTSPQINEKTPPGTNKGYSPAILPIPTYKKSLEILAKATESVSPCPADYDREWEGPNDLIEKITKKKHDTEEKLDNSAKKISIDDYKKRCFKENDIKTKEQNKDSMKIHDKCENPEQDLGYGSDSTLR